MGGDLTEDCGGPGNGQLDVVSLASGRESTNTDSMWSPQPFTVNEVKACEETKRCDKLYVDDKSLLVNVLVGVSRQVTLPSPPTDYMRSLVCGMFQEDQCEALEIPYTTMRKIEVVQKPGRGSVVTIRVTTPPVASKVPVKSSSGQPLRAGFALASADVERFYAAIRGRGLVSARPLTAGNGPDAGKGEAAQ